MLSDLIYSISLQQQESLNKIAVFYQQQLERFKAPLYYCRGRGILDTAIQDFAIGYDPGGDFLINFLKREEIDWEKFNLLSVNEGGSLYNPQANRLIFPIHSLTHNVIGFSGRVWQADDERSKYYNSALSPVYQKSLTLYGLSSAAHTIGMENYALVVEGNVDVITCHSNNLKTAVATCGSAFTREHLQLLNLFTDRVIFCFDNDESGKKTQLKMQEVFKDEKKVKIGYLNISEVKDIDEFIRQFGSQPILTEIEQLLEEM